MFAVFQLSKLVLVQNCCITLFVVPVASARSRISSNLTTLNKAQLAVDRINYRGVDDEGGTLNPPQFFKGIYTCIICEGRRNWSRNKRREDERERVLREKLCIKIV